MTTVQLFNLNMRPWVKISGAVNQKVRTFFLAAILCQMMMKPGCSLRALMEKYVPALQPMHVRDLVEILVKLGKNPDTLSTYKFTL